MSILPAFSLAPRPAPAPEWPPSPVARGERMRLDDTRRQTGRIEAGETGERGDRPAPGLVLARYGFARAVLDPTQFAPIEAEEDGGPVSAPNPLGRRRYAEMLSDRQLAIPPGEILDLRI